MVISKMDKCIHNIKPPNFGGFFASHKTKPLNVGKSNRQYGQNSIQYIWIIGRKRHICVSCLSWCRCCYFRIALVIAWQMKEI